MENDYLNNELLSSRILNSANNKQLPIAENTNSTQNDPLVYPEIFYKLQPFIILACDQMDSQNLMNPTQDILDQISDGIHDDFCKMYPDLADYAKSNDNSDPSADDPPDDPPPTRYSSPPGPPPPYRRRRRFRRRGMLRDLVDILLLSERNRRRSNY